ncbi:hypothetical protein PHMEG_00031257 [Phytophthora megakarya]|uniref:Uncharacterized protein n=1 Tax=Phytophthora megakarya TaxID=4795 RepID=A0A225UYM3_9STRA|nr:hypothetical protein PHMEG_00031257 [Phytophthora megakarya]
MCHYQYKGAKCALCEEVGMAETMEMETTVETKMVRIQTMITTVVTAATTGNDDDGQREQITVPRQMARSRSRNLRDVELAAYKPTDSTSVAIWIANVDLACKVRGCLDEEIGLMLNSTTYSASSI